YEIRIYTQTDREGTALIFPTRGALPVRTTNGNLVCLTVHPASQKMGKRQVTKITDQAESNEEKWQAYRVRLTSVSLALPPSPFRASLPRGMAGRKQKAI